MKHPGHVLPTLCVLALVLAFGGVFVQSRGLAVEGDLVLKRYVENAMLPPSVFSHWYHRIRYRCYACHPSIFEMKRGTRITMDEIDKGKFCGACHNGKVAWSVSFDSCTKCHVEP